MSRIQFDQAIESTHPSITPRKMRKLNEKISFDSTNSRQNKSIQNEIRLFKGLVRKNSYSMNNPMPIQSFSFSKQSIKLLSPQKMEQQLEFNIARMKSNSNQKNMFGTFSNKKYNDYQSEQELALPILSHKFSLFDQNSNNLFESIDLDLNRHNSTIDTGNNFDQANYGDNIYIKNLELKRTESKLELLKSRSQKKNRTKKLFQGHIETIEQQSQQSDQRLRRDYQIKQKLINSHKNKHETFLCLNKLQRIFYYGKKMFFTQQKSENIDININYCQQKRIPFQKKLYLMQTQLYHKDNDYRLLKIIQYFEESYGVTMIFQLASYSLQDHNSFGIRMKQSEVWSVLSDCAKSLLFLRSQQCHHLNIKPGNILKCKDKFKLSDPYGKISFFSETVNHEELKNIDTNKISLFFPYTAPELIQYRKYLDGINLESSDVYSLGISILTNLIGNQFLFYIQQRQFHKIKKIVCKNLHNYSPTLKKLLLRMISFDPSKRPEFEQLANIEFEQVQSKNKIQRSFSI